MYNKTNNEELFSKYEYLFKIARKISLLYYKSHYNFFKHISYDYNDLVQEVYLKILPSIEKYHKKYKNKKKLYPEKFIKIATNNALKNIVRDNFNKQLLPLLDNLLLRGRKYSNNLDIKELIKKYSNNTREYFIVYKHLFENRSFAELAEEYKVSRSRIHQINKKVINNLIKDDEILY